MHVVDQAEFTRMHYVDRSRGGVAISPWAMSPEKVKAVCAHRLARIVRARNAPTDPKALREMEARAVIRLRRFPAGRLHVETAERFGGLLAYWLGVIYRHNNLRMTIPELIVHYGVNRNTFIVLLNRLNNTARYLFPEQENHRPWRAPVRVRSVKLRNYIEPADLEEILKLRLEGLSADKIAALTGFTKQAVQHKLPKHLKKIRRTVDVEQVLRMQESGSTTEQIAQALGFHPNSICMALRRRRAACLSKV